MKCFSVKVTPGWSFYLVVTNLIAQKLLCGLDSLVSFKYLGILSKWSSLRAKLFKGMRIQEIITQLTWIIKNSSLFKTLLGIWVWIWVLPSAWGDHLHLIMYIQGGFQLLPGDLNLSKPAAGRCFIKFPRWQIKFKEVRTIYLIVCLFIYFWCKSKKSSLSKLLNIVSKKKENIPHALILALLTLRYNFCEFFSGCLLEKVDLPSTVDRQHDAELGLFQI